MTPQDEIIGALRKNRDEIRRYGVQRLGVFGSVARGEARPDSDVDLLVEFTEPSFDNFMELAFFLENLLGRKVELICPDSLRPSMRSRIEKDLLLVA